MDLRVWLTRPFKFAAVPVSVLTLIVYGAVFVAVLLSDQTPDVPKNEQGLNLQKAYEDLHVVRTFQLWNTRILNFR